MKEYKFTEKELQDLGFERHFETKESSGYHCDYTYYTFEFSERNNNCLISGCFEKDIEEVNVEMFEEDSRQLSREFIMACVEEFGDD